MQHYSFTPRSGPGIIPRGFDFSSEEEEEEAFIVYMHTREGAARFFFSLLNLYLLFLVFISLPYFKRLEDLATGECAALGFFSMDVTPVRKDIFDSPGFWVAFFRFGLRGV